MKLETILFFYVHSENYTVRDCVDCDYGFGDYVGGYYSVGDCVDSNYGVSDCVDGDYGFGDNVGGYYSVGDCVDSNYGVSMTPDL